MMPGRERLFEEREVVAATGGRLVHSASPGITGVVVDSRKVTPGRLFAALAGERTDGHEFLDQAAQAGASLLLVSQEQAAARRGQLERLAGAFPLSVVAVADPLSALQDLARYHLSRLPSMTRIAVTGSNGKTTTKELIASILRRAVSTFSNEGNLNSEIGLPLACFDVTAVNRYAVFEMGINHPGEMEVLADIIRPDLALITNIGVAHVGLLGSREGIAREKSRIFSRFDGRQTALLPESTPFRTLLEHGVKGRIVYYGKSSTPGYQGSEPRGLEGTLIRWEGLQVRFPLLGPHNLSNALAAISVAKELGVSREDIRDGLESAVPLFGRGQLHAGPVTVLADCYNANPDSMASALDFLEEAAWEGRKVAVLGSMRELGPETAQAHRSLGERLRGSALALLFLYGAEMENAWNAMAGGPAADRCKWFVSMEQLVESVRDLLRPGDLVLLKGSRSLEMEQLLPFITGGGVPAGHGEPGRPSRC